jgi:putative flippase GtrA
VLAFVNFFKISKIPPPDPFGREMLSAKQFLLFCIVGVIATVVDFGAFNALTGRAARWRRIPANMVSVTLAMAWSFLANWFVVFHPDSHNWLARAGRFLVTTAFSAFVLQNAILYVTTYVWNGPVNLALAWARRLRPNHHLDDDAIARNTCKSLAVSAGLTWNFFWYKYFVYAS